MPKYYGNLAALKPLQRYILLRQLHKARRAGLHTDVRIGAPLLGLFSWAAPKDLPTVLNLKRLLITQPLHTYLYKDFQGILRSKYGEGTVKKLLLSPIIILLNTGDTIKFKRDTEEDTPVYTMIKTKNGNWITTMKKNAVYRIDHLRLARDRKIRKLIALLFIKLDKDHILKYAEIPFLGDLLKEAVKHYNKWLKNSTDVSIFTDSEDSPKAVLSLYPSNHMKDTSILNNFYIEPLLRGKGLGSKMLELALKYAKLQKIKNLIINWNAKNKGALKLYSKKGFSILNITGKKLI